MSELTPTPPNALMQQVHLRYRRHLEQRIANVAAIFHKGQGFFPGMDEEALSRLRPDWLSGFIDTTSGVFDEQMQDLWARILAGELEHPGSYSKRTLSILRDLTQEEARTFERMAACVVFSDDDAYLYDDAELNEQFGISVFDILNTENAKLLNAQALSLETSVREKNYPVLHNGKEIMLATPIGKSGKLSYSVMQLTHAGRELLQVARSTINGDYWTELQKRLAARTPRLTYTVHRIRYISEQGEVDCEDLPAHQC